MPKSDSASRLQSALLRAAGKLWGYKLWGQQTVTRGQVRARENAWDRAYRANQREAKAAALEAKRAHYREQRRLAKEAGQHVYTGPTKPGGEGGGGTGGGKSGGGK